MIRCMPTFNTKLETDIIELTGCYGQKDHPDLHSEKEKHLHTARMQQVNEAYSVLSSKENRAKYDQLGERWKEGAPPPPPEYAQGGAIIILASPEPKRIEFIVLFQRPAGLLLPCACEVACCPIECSN